MHVIRKIRIYISLSFYTDQNSFPAVVSDVALDHYLNKDSKESFNF